MNSSIKKSFFSFIILVLLIAIFEGTLTLGGFLYSNFHYGLNNPQIDKDAFRILFLGESTTQGHTLEMKNAYPAQVENILQLHYPNKKIKSYNKGINAIETTAILRNLNRNVANYRPHLVILMAGRNDNFIEDNRQSDLKIILSKSKIYRLIISIKDIPKVVISDIRKDDGDFRYVHQPYHYKPVNLVSEGISNFNNIIDIVHTYGSKIWLTGYFQPDARENVNPLLEQIASENNITYIDDYPKVDFKINSSLFMEDGWHPNKEGHRIIAEKIAETIINKKIVDNLKT
ncbi:MAG: hypothetical protein KKA79_06120 [Nanoarchaeota archaeon]|nr:hypothetical protein [Nanoarchaeota archaeon]